MRKIAKIDLLNLNNRSSYAVFSCCCMIDLLQERQEVTSFCDIERSLSRFWKNNLVVVIIVK